MTITSAEFVISNTDYRKCPPDPIPEMAFIGRSNVGKSSLINMLCGKKDLAKTSSKPGKTQLLNHFSIDNKRWFLVDLPGYGYAKTAKTDREKWKKMIDDYLRMRENLYCVFVLIDARIAPQALDLAFIERLGVYEIPFVLVFTKIDKISKAVQKHNEQAFLDKLAETWEELPPHFSTSASSGAGKPELLAYIYSLLPPLA